MRRLSPRSGARPSGGYTLPLTLFAVMILATSARLISRYATEGYLTLHEIRHGELSHEKLKHTIARVPWRGDGCSSTPVFDEGATIHVVACGDPFLPFNTQPPIALPSGTIDYDAIFQHASRCQSSSLNQSSGSSNTPHAIRDCEVSGSYQQNIIALENLEASELLIKGKSAALPAMLASPGSIRISTALLIETDLTIVAGGTIEIEKIANIGTGEVRVAIFSSLGSVDVRSVASGVLLLLGGRSTLHAPTTAPSPSYPLPPFRAPTLRGFLKR